MGTRITRIGCYTALADSVLKGKVGNDSAAAKFASATNLKIEDDKPYAEVCYIDLITPSATRSNHKDSYGWEHTPPYHPKNSRHNDHY